MAFLHGTGYDGLAWLFAVDQHDNESGIGSTIIIAIAVRR